MVGQITVYWSSIWLFPRIFQELPKPSLSSVAHHFSSSGIQIVSSGRYLGDVIGEVSGIESFVQSKVNDWSH